MGMRAGLLTIGAAFRAAFAADNTTVAAIRAVAMDKKLRFRGFVTIGAEVFDIADDRGKFKVFTDVDDLVKALSAHLPTATGAYTVVCDTGTLLVKPLPADLVKSAASDRTKYQAKKTAMLATVAALDANLLLMDGWENGNALQVARKAEVDAEKVSINADIAVIDAEIARLTTIVGS